MLGYSFPQRSWMSWSPDSLKREKRTFAISMLRICLLSSRQKPQAKEKR